MPIPQLRALIGVPVPLQIPLLDLHAVFCAAGLDVQGQVTLHTRVQIGGQGGALVIAALVGLAVPLCADQLGGGSVIGAVQLALGQGQVGPRRGQAEYAQQRQADDDCRQQQGQRCGPQRRRVRQPQP